MQLIPGCPTLISVSADDEQIWLTDEEQDAWRSLIGVLIRLPGALDRQLQRDTDLRHMDYQVLAMLSEADEGTMRMSSLAARVESSLPRLSQVVGRLEQRGWVHRHPDLTDGRYTLATLTADGCAAVQTYAPSHVAEVRRLVFDPLTASQVKQLDTIARRILGAIEAADEA